MPVYNTGKYLERCLNSILNQTYTNWELIVVNDGSTDNSLEILKSYAQKDNRITVLEQENQGQAVARNKALDLVKGEYICFIDSDDWVDVDFLEELYKAITSTNSEIVMSNFFFSTDKGQKIGYKFSSNVIPLREYKSKLIKDEITSYLWNCIFKKELFNNLRFDNLMACEDSVLLTKLLSRLKKDVVVVNKALYHYYQRENSTIYTKVFKRELCFFEAYKYRYNLDYINNEEKAYCLKHMMISFYSFYQTFDYKKDEIDNCLEVIKSADKNIFNRARKLLSISQLLRFLLAYYFPIFYNPLYRLYLMKTRLLPPKDLLEYCETKII